MKIQWKHMVAVGCLAAAMVMPAVTVQADNAASTVDLRSAIANRGATPEPGLAALTADGVVVRKLSESYLHTAIQDMNDTFGSNKAGVTAGQAGPRIFGEVLNRLSKGGADIYQIRVMHNQRQYTAWLAKSEISPEEAVQLLRHNKNIPSEFLIDGMGQSLYEAAGKRDASGAWRLRPAISEPIVKKLNEVIDTAVADAANSGRGGEKNPLRSIKVRDKEPVTVLHGRQYDSVITGARIEGNAAGIAVPVYLGVAVAATPRTPVAYVLITADSERRVTAPLLAKLLK